MDNFLKLYQKEMEFQARMMLKFGKKYPILAENLELNVLGSNDANVAKLLESAAFLNAGCQETIEAMFPDYTHMALDILNPGLLSPTIPMSIARFHILPGEREVLHIPKDTKLEALTTTPNKCVFTTAYETRLFPVKVTEAALESPLQFDNIQLDPSVNSILRIRLESTNPLPLIDFTGHQFRLYFNGKSNIVAALFNLIFPDCVRVIILPDEKDPIELPKDSIRTVGFEPSEAILPGFSEELSAYRLLQEYFCTPLKFNFFDIANLDRHARKKIDLLFLTKNKPDFKVGPNLFLTGCTPICNLFKETFSVEIKGQRAQKNPRNELEFTARSLGHDEETTELHSIQSAATSSEFEDADLLPKYGQHGGMAAQEENISWSLRREESWQQNMAGRVAFISFRNRDNKMIPPAFSKVYLKTHCFSRDLARKVIASAKLMMPDRITGIESIDLMAKPTETAYPELTGEGPWRMISTLSLNHLSLVDHGGGEALEALKEILQVHDIRKSSINRKLIRGLIRMETKKTVDRFSKKGVKGWRRGLEITLTVDSAMFVNGSAFLLGSLLDHFFPRYMTQNHFTATVMKQAGSDEEWYRWAPRPGLIAIC